MKRGRARAALVRCALHPVGILVLFLCFFNAVVRTPELFGFALVSGLAFALEARPERVPPAPDNVASG